MVSQGLFQSNPVKTTHDEYYTQKSAWQDKQEFIPRDKQICEAFMLNSKSSSAVYLTELGFNVTWSDIDFFIDDKGDVVVSNCPYSCKKEVLLKAETP
jgi:hypothetical protein